MISEVIVSRLDELIGDYDTPFFNYLLYSYDLSLNDCENIIDELKSDIRTNQVVTDNVASTLEERFKDRVVEMEKNSKLDYLTELISSDNEFYIKYLKKHNLSSDEIGLIYGKVEDRILKDNITDFEIKRYLEYYFSNMVRQASYLSDLDWIVGRNYDTLIIKKAKKKTAKKNRGLLFCLTDEILYECFGSRKKDSFDTTLAKDPKSGRV